MPNCYDADDARIVIRTQGLFVFTFDFPAHNEQTSHITKHRRDVIIARARSSCEYHIYLMFSHTLYELSACLPR